MSDAVDREKLFEQVWSVPMLHLAPTYGLSGPALRQLCVELRVPVPIRGHWARLAAGHVIPRPSLPSLSSPPSAERAGSRRLAPPRNAKAAGDKGPLVEALSNNEVALTEEQFDRVLKPTSFHPLIRDLATSYEKAAVEALQMRSKRDWEESNPGKKYRGPMPRHGEWKYFADAGQILLKTHRKSVLRVSLLTYRCALVLLNSLVEGLEARGYEAQLEGGSERLRGTRSEAHISIRVAERLELGFRIEKEAWRDEPRNVRTFQPTEKLSLGIEQMGWGEVVLADRQGGLLGSDWESVWAAIERQHERSVATRQGRIDQKLAIEEQVRVARERQLLEENRRKLADAERARREALVSEAKDWDAARLIRGYIEHIEREKHDATDAAFLTWRSWALDVAQDLDPSHKRIG